MNTKKRWTGIDRKRIGHSAYMRAYRAARKRQDGVGQCRRPELVWHKPEEAGR